MQLTKEARINYWNEHIKNAALHESGIHGYSQENKISKSALYRWKEYFSNLNSKKIIRKSKASKKRKHQSPFMPVIVEAAELKSSLVLSLLGLVGILGLIVLLAGNSNPLVVERENSLYRALPVERSDIKPTKESVAELVTEFIKARYEWGNFEPQVIVKKLEPFTKEALRTKLFDEFGKKGFQNKPGRVSYLVEILF